MGNLLKQPEKEKQTITKPYPITKRNPKKTIGELTTEQRQSDFIQAFIQNQGLKFKTCAYLELRYSTFRKWLKDARFKQRLDEAQEIVNEQVEQSLINKFNTNSPVPEIFYLRSRDPRYSQRVTMEGDSDKPIIVTHNKDTLNIISKTISEILNKE